MRSRVALLALLLTVVAVPVPGGEEPIWRRAGLSDRQAAVHLLNRLTYGPRPGEIDRVLATGIDRWLDQQLAASLDDSALERRLAKLPGMRLSAAEIADVYPPPGRFLREARAAGALSEDLDPRTLRDDPTDPNAMAARVGLMRFARENGYRRQRELVATLMTQKLMRALYAENQLHEVLTDFWFNHFNVALTDPQCRAYLLAYERDAIRPYVVGSFRDMLGATARHPAMLLYLDNAMSTADEGAPTTLPARTRRRRGRRPASERPQGLNENYARELLELHTLGVDGGYGQGDVVAVARAFTGWTVLPPARARQRLGARLEWALASDVGFVAEDGFLFRADVHDSGSKSVLGRRLSGGRGIEDGEEVLDLVAAHPSTSRHLARKLAIRFVADEPPPELVDRLGRELRANGGDLGRTLRALVESEEFWATEAVGEKIKSPLELAVSALRGGGGELTDASELVEWIGRMGQPLYAFQAPTGYPDRGEFWVNAGALLNRMNFGLALAAGRVDGALLDPLTLTGGREPESRQAALETYLTLLLPELDPAPALARLSPLIADGERQVVGVILGSPEFQRR